MTSYYYLLKGLRRKNSKMIFTNDDVLNPHVKGDKILYKDKEYTVVYVDYCFEDVSLSNILRCRSRQIYLRENKLLKNIL